MTQAVAGFEADILVMSPVWEEKKVPDALDELSRNISVCIILVSVIYPSALPRQLLGKFMNIEDETTKLSERPLEERKLDYIHLANGAQPLSLSSVRNFSLDLL